MSLRSLAVRTTNFTVDQACVEIIAGARAIRVLQINYISFAATVQQIGLGRPAAIGVTPTSPVTFLSLASGDSTSAAKAALAWVTSPTAPAAFMKRANLPATAATAFEWTFGDGGVLVPAGGSLVLWNIAISVASDVSILVND